MLVYAREQRQGCKITRLIKSARCLCSCVFVRVSTKEGRRQRNRARKCMQTHNHTCTRKTSSNRIFPQWSNQPPVVKAGLGYRVYLVAPAPRGSSPINMFPASKVLPALGSVIISSALIRGHFIPPVAELSRPKLR